MQRKLDNGTLNVLGIYFYRKKRLLAKLSGIQKVMETHTTQSVRKVEKEIIEELERVLTQEELLHT